MNLLKLQVMRTLIITSILALLTAAWNTVSPQEFPKEYLGLPGDNLNLYAVMDIFQESETLEAFERKLNDPDSRINNLDLNGDNLVDYIMVEDYVDGNVHSIVLRVAMGRRDHQDVAVFTVQQLADGSVHIQLIGDEALYGRNYIIEPNYNEYYGETPNPGYTGNVRGTRNGNVIHTTTYEVASWPVIRFIYMPGYVAWRSSWYWGYYPTYWNPWRPYYWHYYYGYHYNWYPHYYRHYRVSNHIHYHRYNDFYYSHVRTYSPKVVININKGKYRTTYSKPEMRREGEALYSRVHAGQNTRTAGSAGVSNRERNADGQPASARMSDGSRTVSDRRTSPTTARQAGTGSMNGRSAVNQGRSSSGSQGRVATSRSTDQSVNVRRAPATSSGRESGSATQVQSRSTTRSSAGSSSAGRVSSTSVNQERRSEGSSQIQSRQSPQRQSSTVNERSAVRSSVRTSPASRNASPAVSSGSQVSRSASVQTRSSSPRTEGVSSRSSVSRSSSVNSPAVSRGSSSVSSGRQDSRSASSVQSRTSSSRNEGVSSRPAVSRSSSGNSSSVSRGSTSVSQGRQSAKSQVIQSSRSSSPSAKSGNSDRGSDNGRSASRR